MTTTAETEPMQTRKLLVLLPGVDDGCTEQMSCYFIDDMRDMACRRVI